VNDLEAYWAELKSKDLEAAFPGVKFKEPTEFPWGREIHVIDMAGVCWHVPRPIRKMPAEPRGTRDDSDGPADEDLPEVRQRGLSVQEPEEDRCDGKRTGGNRDEVPVQGMRA